ncbi:MULTISPECIES: glycosyltransferase [unclassified Ruegeria]|uniref:glycosyltransferase n=1 Tax=unclassified Ruegeria TaxID=2625375 RepID=UPI001488C4C4|nr:MULTISPECIES: glycosyltransferase [unclassified Ruegeria]
MKKRAAFIGHTFHEKTGSSKFFQEIVSELFEVDNFFFDPADPFGFDYSSIPDDRYDFLFFWQSELAASRLYNHFSGHFVIVPMFDGSARLKEKFWQRFPRATFVSFSFGMHSILQSASCNSVLVRYYPEVEKRLWQSDAELSAYFWERRPGSGYDGETVIEACRVLGIQKLQIHLAGDFSSEIEERKATLLAAASSSGPAIELAFSEWFDSKAQAIAEARKHAVYFAPREAEGIGMSFLEAMASGQIVIGPDKPTLNEYISDGETGFLLGKNHGSESLPSLTENGLLEMSDRILESVARGRKNWLQDVKRLEDVLTQGYTANISDPGSEFERQVTIQAGLRQ